MLFVDEITLTEVPRYKHAYVKYYHTRTVRKLHNNVIWGGCKLLIELGSEGL